MIVRTLSGPLARRVSHRARRFASVGAVAGLLAFALPAGTALAQSSTLEARGVQPGDVDAARGGTSAELVLRALGLLGIHYRFGGNTPDAGLDCSGLVRHVFRETVGLVLPRRSEEMSRAGDPVAGSDLRPGDLVFFNTLRKTFSHVGIYIGDSKFVHAPSAGGRVRIERIDGAYWASRFDGARRVLADGSKTSGDRQALDQLLGRLEAVPVEPTRNGLFGPSAATNPMLSGQGIPGVYTPGAGLTGAAQRPAAASPAAVLPDRSQIF